jgi:polysaccharide export outer membrane protein
MSRLVLGAGDEAEMVVYGVPDLKQHLRISSSGDVYLPLIGKITLAGLTADDAQALIEKKYAEGGFLKNPHVTLIVKDYTTQGITISGEVNRPGTYSALGARRLFDLFQMAGGLTPKAGNRVAITRAGPEPKSEILRLTSDPVKSVENNVPLQPGDSIIVSRAGIVYVVGEVSRPGGYVIDNPDGSLTVMQVIAMAAGPTRLANLGHSKLLRRTPTGLENEQLDLKKIIEAKSPDIPLQAEDIVWVPPSKGKIAGERGASSILTMLTSLAIYRF